MSGAELEVGRVVRPHGLRGQVVVAMVTNRPERLEPGALLGAEGRQLEVAAAGPAPAGGGGARYIVSFQGVSDRAGAEALRGLVLTAEPIEDPSAMWVHELIGSEVLDADGAGHGRVTAVEANPASDLLVLEGGALVPLRFVVDRGPGWVRVEVPPGLWET